MSSPTMMVGPGTKPSMLGEQTRPVVGEKTAPTGSSITDAKGLDKACAEFESLFIYQLLKEMRASIPEGGYLGESTQSKTYTSMFDIEIAREISSQRGIGLADFLRQQLASRFADAETQLSDKEADSY
jgi:peptidoglycan hydrolase FlgJ